MGLESYGNISKGVPTNLGILSSGSTGDFNVLQLFNHAYPMSLAGNSFRSIQCVNGFSCIGHLDIFYCILQIVVSIISIEFFV